MAYKDKVMDYKFKDDAVMTDAWNPNYNYMDCVVKVSKLNNDMDMEPMARSNPRGKMDAS